MNKYSPHLVLAAALALAACAEPPAAHPPEQPDTRAADEAIIRTAAEEWSASAQAKDAEAFASFYTEDAILMIEDAPDMSGVAAIREGISGMMQDPNFDLRFETDQVVVSRSSDIAYETGTYVLTMSDPDQNPTTEKGHYVVIWRKQLDGGWKVALDAPVSDPPEENMTEKLPLYDLRLPGPVQPARS